MRIGQPAGPFLREYTPASGIHRPSTQIALVLFYRGGGHSVLTVDGAQHVGRRRFARINTICEIALETHCTTIYLALPALAGASFFQAEVDLLWTADDPFLVAVNVVRDVATLLTAPILERLRRVSGRFEVGKAEEANEAVTAQCASGRWDDLGYQLGLRTRLYVRLTVDAATIAHAQDLREHSHSWDKERQVTERMAERMAWFRQMLTGEGWDHLSYVLADNPREARAFMKQLREERRSDEREFLTHALGMIERGVIQSADLEQQIRELLSSGTFRVDGPIGPDAVLDRDRPEQPSTGTAKSFVPSWAMEATSGPPWDVEQTGRAGRNGTKERH